MLHVNEDILCKLLNKFSVESFFEIIDIEFHQRKGKWIFLGIHKHPAQSDNELIEAISSS